MDASRAGDYPQLLVWMDAGRSGCSQNLHEPLDAGGWLFGDGDLQFWIRPGWGCKLYPDLHFVFRLKDRQQWMDASFWRRCHYHPVVQQWMDASCWRSNTDVQHWLDACRWIHHADVQQRLDASPKMMGFLPSSAKSTTRQAVR